MLCPEEEELCTEQRQVHVYFPHLPHTLEQEVKLRGLFDEGKAWFLLNDLTKALEMLGAAERVHWGISPATVFVGLYGNYYLHDSLFILGPHPSSICLSSLEIFSIAKSTPNP